MIVGLYLVLQGFTFSPLRNSLLFLFNHVEKIRLLRTMVKLEAGKEVGVAAREGEEVWQPARVEQVDASIALGKPIIKIFILECCTFPYN
jgi:hypothetical protein